MKAGPGRPKGSPNKITKDIKAAIQEAFFKAGGVEYLLRLAHEDHKTFCSLVGRVVPLQVSGDADNPLFPNKIEIRLVKPKA